MTTPICTEGAHAIAARKWLKAFAASENYEAVAGAANQLATNPSQEAAYASGNLDLGRQFSQAVLEVPGAGPWRTRQEPEAIKRELHQCTEALLKLGLITAS